MNLGDIIQCLLLVIATGFLAANWLELRWIRFDKEQRIISKGQKDRFI
jgi:hypothetical protein